MPQNLQASHACCLRRPHIACSCLGCSGAQAGTVPTFQVAADAASPREVKIDTSYRWARTRYNTTQRTFSFWAFALTLRARLTLLDQKWSYIGGFTEAKYATQLPCPCCLAEPQGSLSPSSLGADVQST